MAKAKIDPFILDETEARKQRSETKGKNYGIPCPKRNDKGACEGCDYISKIYNDYPGEGYRDHPARKFAAAKKAKANGFVNIVLESNPDKNIILEIGSKAANSILEGIETKGWVDIAHPHKGKGRELLISKTKGDSGYNEYSVSPKLQNADWAIKDSIWKNAYNLDNIVEMMNNDELTDDNYLNISKIKMDETLAIRILPPWVNDDDDNKRIMKILWRHWGLSKDQLEGDESINWKTGADESSDDEGVKEGKLDLPSDDIDGDSTPKKSKDDEKEKSVKQPPCFGDPEYYEDDDETCQDCAFFKKCAKKVMAA